MYVLGMLENGAAGYITKDEAPNMLLTALRSIINDRVKWISPKVANQVSQVKMDDKSFTGHELEILRYILLGKTDDEIMNSMGINEKLYRRYIKLLMTKVDVATREELTEIAKNLLSISNS